MKEVFTSNYAREGKNERSFSISVKPPRWFAKLPHLPDLAPTWEIVHDYKESGDIKKYIEQFWDLLLNKRNLDPVKIADSLPANCILLCYEKPSDFCHRQLVAEWLNSTGEISVKEMLKPKEKVWTSDLLKPKAKQVTIEDILNKKGS